MLDTNNGYIQVCVNSM